MLIYLVMNTDHDGDLTTIAITKEVFDWINLPYSPEDKTASSYMEDIPDFVTVWEDADAEFQDDARHAYITRGSPQNDRALMVNSNIDGFQDVYHDIVDFFKDLRMNQAVVVDVFEGMIY